MHEIEIHDTRYIHDGKAMTMLLALSSHECNITEGAPLQQRQNFSSRMKFTYEMEEKDKLFDDYCTPSRNLTIEGRVSIHPL